MSEWHDDPFIFDGDIVNDQGNSKSPNLPTVTKQAGFQAFQPKLKSFDVNTQEYLEFGDAERGKGKKKKAAVNHHQRCRNYLEGLGYTVDKVERWVTLPSGFMFKQDLRGLWDYKCDKGGRVLYVQLCGNWKDMQAHLRTMCSDKIATDNKRPRIENLRRDLASGASCALLGFEKQENGRYQAVYKIITDRDIEGVISRRRKTA